MIPVLILFARVIDVSIGTMRIILLSKGYRGYAGMLGFVESLVWITATVQIMQNLDSIYNYIAYAGGFGLGTYVGVLLEQKISIGKVIVRIITYKDNSLLVEKLREENYSMTTIDAEGRFGYVKVLFLVTDRRQVNKLAKLINEYHPKAFYTIEDIRYVNADEMKKQSPVFRISRLRSAFNKRK
jgi:uncharacterized protein YebE (UPF0316 family)